MAINTWSAQFICDDDRSSLLNRSMHIHHPNNQERETCGMRREVLFKALRCGRAYEYLQFMHNRQLNIRERKNAQPKITSKRKSI